jgi:16S rRNA processing protein RimM
MRLTVGRISKPHGIRGEVLIEVRTDDPEERFAAGSGLLTDPAPAVWAGNSSLDKSGGAAWSLPEVLTIISSRPHHNRYILQLDGICDRNSADQLRGVLLSIDSADLTVLEDPDDFHDHQLVGLTAVDPNGQPLGEVVRVEHPPAADLLVLRCPDGRTGLVPFVRAMVPEVDLVAGRVVMTLPDGLLDL